MSQRGLYRIGTSYKVGRYEHWCNISFDGDHIGAAKGATQRVAAERARLIAGRMEATEPLTEVEVRGLKRVLHDPTKVDAVRKWLETESTKP